jgi:transposase
MSKQRAANPLPALTETQYQAAVRYSSQADEVLSMVHAVLVEGRGVSDVARAFEVSRANVYRGIDAFQQGGSSSRQRFEVEQVEQAVLQHTRDALSLKVAKLYLVNGYSCKYIAKECCLSVEKVHDLTRRAVKWLNEPDAGSMKARREELPRITFALHDWHRFIRKVTGLSESTIEMAEKYHLQGMTRHQIAQAMNRRASDVYRNLQTFAKRYEKWHAEQNRVHPIVLEQPNLFSRHT